MVVLHEVDRDGHDSFEPPKPHSMPELVVLISIRHWLDCVQRGGSCRSAACLLNTDFFEEGVHALHHHHVNSLTRTQPA